MTDAAQAVAFLKAFFQGVAGDAFICSLPNRRGGRPGEVSLISRDPKKLKPFIEKWDRPGRGLFFCVATLKPGAQAPGPGKSVRCKAHVWRLPCLHVDIDFDNLELGENPQAEVTKVLERFAPPPSITVLSGGGVHVYWRLERPFELELEGAIGDAEQLLRQAVHKFGGDPSAAEVARLLRLPGTTNSKEEYGGGRAVLLSKSTLEPCHLSAALSRVFLGKPALTRLSAEPPANGATPRAETNPFEEYAKTHGFKTPIDVDARLAAMRYQGTGEAGIHATQLSVTASLLNAGVPLAETVRLVLEATQRAADGQRWDWRREQRELEGMCRTWQEKRGQALPNGEAHEEETVAGEEASVAASSTDEAPTESDAKTQVKPKTKKATPGGFAHKLAATVLHIFHRGGEQLMLTAGNLWTYRNETWRAFDHVDRQRLEVALVEQLGSYMTMRLVAQIRHLILNHPSLYRPDVEFDALPLLPMRNGMLDLETRQLRPHAPEDYITHKSPISYVAGAECPLWLEHLERTLSTYGSEDAADIAATLHEFMGAALHVKALRREQRTGLWITGPSNTGKSEIGAVIRGLIGPPVAATTVKDMGEKYGLQNMIGASAWITDEATAAAEAIDSERYKMLITGEPVDVRMMGVKATRALSFHFPVVLICNNLPKVSDETMGLFNRTLVLEFKRIFSDDEAVLMARKLGVEGPSIGQWLIEKEGPGILNEALAGRERLLRRGRYERPPVIAGAVHEFRKATSIVSDFLEAAAVREANGRLPRADLLHAFRGYEIDQNGKKARQTAARSFWQRLRKSAAWCDADGFTSHSGARHVTGIELNEEGRRLLLVGENEG